MPVPHHQTITFLTKRFREAGIRISRRHGQNFLIDLNLQRLIINAAEITDRDVVLEVGTGTGALTALIAERAKAVVTVEIDPHLYQLASEELIDFQNVTMLRQDALKNKNHFDQGVLDAVAARLAEDSQSQFKLVANLPYNIATPVLSNLLSGPVLPTSMTATIQKELAERIVARPGTKDYSALSVWMQSQCRVEIVRVLPSSVFWPAPKVTSAIVKIEPDATLRQRIPDLPFFKQFVRSMFFHRRKFLRRVVIGAAGDQFTKEDVDRLLEKLKLEPQGRAEQLSVEQIIELSEEVRQASDKSS